jgi:YD repeat-containing protein
MLIALNTFNRNVYMETPELLVDTTAGKLDLGLNFNSCSPTEQHWRCNFLSELRLVTGSPHNHYVFTAPSGSEVIYSYDATSGHYIAPKDSDNPQSYIEVTATGADWYDPHSNQRKRFESSGALLRQSAIIAANGQSLRFNYVAGKDWFESIYDPQADCYYRVNFSGNSVNISHEKTTLGRTTTNLLVQYNFNKLFERLESIKSYSTDMSIGRTTSSYDTNIEYSTNPTGHIYTITQSDGVIYHLDCNHSGQLKYIYLTDEKRPYYRVKQQDNKTLVYTRPFEDTSVLKRLFGGVVKENHQGICFSHTADGRYEQITNEMPDHMLEEGDTIEREYVTLPTAKTFDWTADKQLKRVFHADLSQTQYEYHASGALKSEKVLDKNLAVVSKTEFSYNTFGAVIELKQTVNTTTVETTHFYYDETLEADSGCRRLLYKVLPGGRVEEYLYDDKGMQTTTKQFTNTLSYVPTQAQLTALSTWCANETAEVNFIFVQRTFNDYGQAESRSNIDDALRYNCYRLGV